LFFPSRIMPSAPGAGDRGANSAGSRYGSSLPAGVPACLRRPGRALATGRPRGSCRVLASPTRLKTALGGCLGSSILRSMRIMAMSRSRRCLRKAGDHDPRFRRAARICQP
jgi:hypothetical protein